MPATAQEKLEFTGKIDQVKKDLETFQKKGFNKATAAEIKKLQDYTIVQLTKTIEFIKKHDVAKKKYTTAVDKYPTTVTDKLNVFTDKKSTPAAWTDSIKEVIGVFNALRSIVNDKAL